MDKIILNADKSCDRIDTFIAENTEISRSRAVKLIEAGEVM